MKNLLGCVLVLGLSLSARAQTILGQGPRKPLDFPPPAFGAGGSCPQGTTNLCIPLDGSFTPVDMNQPGWSGPASPSDPCQRNDDDSGLFPLNGWSFKHFGVDYNEVYINNNGNLSFGVAFSTFSPTGFPTAGFPMVAPFWGDVDTGDTLDTFGGVTWVREESIAAGDALNRLTVIWDRVGCYDEQGDLQNTFEVILTDGNDPSMGNGNNVCFCYDDVTWTTGDASGGTGGFGGAPATVGANQGNGVDFFQIGTFDHAGNGYDGPAGGPDGVDWLDGTTFCFNISGSAPNVPPIWLNPPRECFDVELGQALQFSVQATGPEIGQLVTISADPPALSNLDCVFTDGNPASSLCTFTPDSSQVGEQTFVLRATDDGSGTLATTLEICIDVSDPAGSPFCFGDGSGTPCPCGTGNSDAGCPNTAGSGVVLRASGQALFSADTFRVSVNSIPGFKPGLLLAGTLLVNNGAGFASGDGILCTSASLRSQVLMSSASGNVTVRDWRGQPFSMAPGVANAGMPSYYQWWYRDPTSQCTGSGFNFSNAWMVTWLP